MPTISYRSKKRKNLTLTLFINIRQVLQVLYILTYIDFSKHTIIESEVLLNFWFKIFDLFRNTQLSSPFLHANNYTIFFEIKQKFQKFNRTIALGSVFALFLCAVVPLNLWLKIFAWFWKNRVCSHIVSIDFCWKSLWDIC